MFQCSKNKPVSQGLKFFFKNDSFTKQVERSKKESILVCLFFQPRQLSYSSSQEAPYKLLSLLLHFDGGLLVVRGAIWAPTKGGHRGQINSWS